MCGMVGCCACDAKVISGYIIFGAQKKIEGKDKQNPRAAESDYIRV